MSKLQLPADPAEAVAAWNEMAEAPLRERFAAAALTGLLAAAAVPPKAADAACDAWIYADAMIAERRRRAECRARTLHPPER